jgi:hypothetical protein
MISYTAGANNSANLTTYNLSNQSNAQSTLTMLNTAITDVAAQDGYIGAQINTLNAVSSVLSTQQENVTSAQNAVQATDYASATSNMSKYENRHLRPGPGQQHVTGSDQAAAVRQIATNQGRASQTGALLLPEAETTPP